MNTSNLCSILTLNAEFQEVVNLFNEAHSLILEILNDQHLRDFVFDATGKHLAIINAGAQITSPSVTVSFLGSDVTNSDNIMQSARYNVAFSLPFWGDNALAECHDFLDVAMLAFFEHELRGNPNPLRRNKVLRISPSIVEQNDDSDSWTVTFEVTVSVFF